MDLFGLVVLTFIGHKQTNQTYVGFFWVQTVYGTIKQVKQCSTHQNKLYTLLIMDLKTWINFNYNWSGSGDISTLVPAGGGEQDWEDAGQFSQAHQLTLPAQPCQQCTLRLLRQVQNLFSLNYNKIGQNLRSNIRKFLYTFIYSSFVKWPIKVFKNIYVWIKRFLF